MQYAKIENNQIKEIGPLSVLFPHTGFSSGEATLEFMQENNIMEVIDSIAYNEDIERVEFTSPYFRDGKVYVINTVQMTEEERTIFSQTKKEGKWISIRQERNDRLLESDWTQLNDSPVDKQVWATYRQQLRDVTLQPDPFNIDWPVKP